MKAIFTANGDGTGAGAGARLTDLTAAPEVPEASSPLLPGPAEPDVIPPDPLSAELQRTITHTVIFLGAPDAGKSTLLVLLAEALGRRAVTDGQVELLFEATGLQRRRDELSRGDVARTGRGRTVDEAVARQRVGEGLVARFGRGRRAPVVLVQSLPGEALSEGALDAEAVTRLGRLAGVALVPVVHAARCNAAFTRQLLLAGLSWAQGQAKGRELSAPAAFRLMSEHLLGLDPEELNAQPDLLGVLEGQVLLLDDRRGGALEFSGDWDALHEALGVFVERIYLRWTPVLAALNRIARRSRVGIITHADLSQAFGGRALAPTPLWRTLGLEEQEILLMTGVRVHLDPDSGTRTVVGPGPDGDGLVELLTRLVARTPARPRRWFGR